MRPWSCSRRSIPSWASTGHSFSTEIDNFTSGASTIGTTWPYQVNTLQAAGVPVQAVVPSEGMTGWADTWMMSSKAANPNCMQKWMAWMLTPEVQAQVAEYFGEAPANPKACQYLDVGYGSYAVPGLLRQVRRQRPGLLRQDLVLEDPPGRLRRRSGRHLHRLRRVDQQVDRDQGLTATR